MNHWAHLLAECPPTLQRAIARAQRISLPRGCGSEERQRRLRRALCRPTAVRAAFQTLDAADRAAVVALRARCMTLLPNEVTRRLGALRPLAALLADPRPRSLAERLLLLGWLLPRPARPHHPAGYRLPPELRRWLPVPLELAEYGPALAATRPLALRAAEALLLAGTHAPLALRADGALTIESLRRLAPLLAPLPLVDAATVFGFTWPLLLRLGLVSAANGLGLVAPGAAGFLARSPAERAAQLRAAWVATPGAEPWISPLLIDQRGIDWPRLRRRLLAWAESLPAARLLDPAALFPALVAAHGPLANAQTHGFRAVDRVPWQPRRAAAIWQAALRGPLTWLGLIDWDAAGRCFRQEAGGRTTDDGRRTTDGEVVPGWVYGAPGEVRLPAGALGPAALRLAAYAPPVGTDQVGVLVQITPEALAQAALAGWDGDHPI